MFRHGLSWLAARALLASGSYVRRERWTDKRLFLTAGGLVWVDASPSRVVQDGDFGRAEFLANDWTDMGFDQGDCIDHPGWTHISIDETRVFSVAADVDVRAASLPYRQRLAYPGASVDPTLPEGVITIKALSAINIIVSGRTDSGMRAWRGLGTLDETMLSDPVFSISTGDWKTFSFPARLLAGEWIALLGIHERSVYAGLRDISLRFSGSAVALQRTIPNPFSAACRVEIAGTVRDLLLLNARDVLLPVSFVLSEGASFTLGAKLFNPAVQPVAALDLEVDLSL